MMICCVKTGSKYGDEYVRRLQAGVSRNLPKHDGHVFTCFTDKPVEGVMCEELPADLPGWWSKLNLFKLRQPLIYFDLDVVNTGDLTPLLEWDGFGIIRDWWQPCFNSSVMKLTGDEGHVWDDFTRDVMSRLRGDQDWITEVMPHGRTFPKEWFASYKANACAGAVPDGAMAVIFHGRPKMHECGGWVKELWR